MSIRCVGCNTSIGWDGRGTLYYTCPCGSHILYDNEHGNLILPGSLILATHEKREPPHLDYLVGGSNFTSPLKEGLVNELRGLGAVWMKDCKQCLESGTYQEKLNREKDLAILETESILRRAKNA